MHPSLQNAHLHPAATAMNRPSKLIQTIVGSHQPVGLKILRLAIGPPIVSERPLAGPVGQPDPGYHRFFAVRPGKDSSSGRMLWRPNFTCFMGPCGQPRAKQHPSTVQAVRNQGCLLRSALRSAELSNCIPTPHEFYQCKYANFKFSQPPYRPRELDRKSAICGLTINESTRSGDAG
jgi:hypothetical protein